MNFSSRHAREGTDHGDRTTRRDAVAELPLIAGHRWLVVAKYPPQGRSLNAVKLNGAIAMGIHDAVRRPISAREAGFPICNHGAHITATQGILTQPLLYARIYPLTEAPRA